MGLKRGTSAEREGETTTGSLCGGLYSLEVSHNNPPPASKTKSAIIPKMIFNSFDMHTVYHKIVGFWYTAKQ